MHAVLYVLVPKEEVNSSIDARRYVASWLASEGFVMADTGESTGGRFKGVCDWFVIGGRWSGILTKVQLDLAKVQKAEQEFEDKYGWWIGGEENITEETRKKQYEEIFFKYFPEFKGNVPAWRDSYCVMGYEDDAQIVNDAIYEHLIKNSRGKTNFWDGGCVVSTDESLDYEKDSVVGKAWIVVVDFHF